ncbi:hypothetical protein [uncultured Chryseobacterium sp.]|uniref:hypothetical protein n=1 Tax=uncultured Chryseobacterium sp. TaxID=259322 RepID=UPI0025D41A5D|nr:hypothetical protein [uncultured Chryseobacterium sp.]
MQSKVLNNNKSIALFMEFDIIIENFHNINILQDPKGKSHDLGSLKYDQSWDALIPVIDKIKTVCIKEFFKYYPKWQRLIDSALSELDLKKLYGVAVDFIKWYNDKIKQS